MPLEKALWCPLLTDSIDHFLLEDGKNASYEGGNGLKGVYFPPQLAFQPLIIYFIGKFFADCTLTWRASNYVCHQGKGLCRRKETKNT